MAKGSVFLLVWLLVPFVQALVIQRPCMNVVKYVSQLDTRLLADIVLKDPAGLEGVWLNITFDLTVDILANQFGPASTSNQRSFLIKRLDFTLKSGELHIVRIYVKHNPVVTPSIIKVLLNGRSLCPGHFDLEERQCPFCPNSEEVVNKECSLNQANFEASGQLNLAQNKTLLDAYRGVGGQRNRFNAPRIAIVDVKKVCGTVSVTKDKIQGGLLAEEGHFPWQMAMIHTIGVNTQYVCSAGLISQKYALTAAHCVTIRSTGKVKPKNEYFLYAGTTKLNTKSNNVQIFQLASIEVHPKYDTTNLEDDIAILGLHSLADIGEYVRPICLPTENMSISDMYKRRALVAGWGYTEYGLVNDLRYAGMPIETPDRCLWSDRKFYSLFISPKVFCAGAKNGTSVCQGDSGAPLALESTETGEEDRYYVRGIVSLSKTSFGLNCSAHDYAIFTDVRSYMPWIREVVDIY